MHRTAGDGIRQRPPLRKSIILDCAEQPAWSAIALDIPDGPRDHFHSADRPKTPSTAPSCSVPRGVMALGRQGDEAYPATPCRLGGVRGPRASLYRAALELLAEPAREVRNVTLRRAGILSPGRLFARPAWSPTLKPVYPGGPGLSLAAHLTHETGSPFSEIERLDHETRHRDIDV